MKYILSFLFLLTNCSLYSQPAATAGQGKVYALVIGISKYLQKDIPELQFADRDAQVFADFLKSKAGGSVSPENIQLLVNEDATSAAVHNAIYWLKTTCKKEDLVFFYFSGHGDVENVTMYKNGFLICYDSPPNNYVNFTLSVDYLNDIANTLSVETKANVVLITDACHSGKLAGSKHKGNFLVGEQLKAVKNKEIRIASSAADQLSNEMEEWGGGRGVFSYYLINGLKGLADIEKDGMVTLEEIKKYLDSSFAKDPVLKRENIKQNPVLNGSPRFVLAKVDEAEKKEAAKEIAEGHSAQMTKSGVESSTVEEMPANPRDYFFTLLKKQNLEELTDRFKLNQLSAEQIAAALVKIVADSVVTDHQRNTIRELEKTLKGSPEALKRFNGRLAVAFDEKGQQVIDQYLAGDAAELERRRYYNIASNGYDVYTKMFEVALKLTQPDNYLYNILKVKLHYFSGVAARLKIPTVKDPRPLIEKAYAEQKKALALEENAAYIYNELGILYVYKKDYAAAQKHFLKATEIATEWAIPLSNLAGIYTHHKKYDLAAAALEKAKELKPDFQNIYIDEGVLYEKRNNLLLAEELYHTSIRLNSRHYFPFERLGYVNMISTEYAAADSFFHEAEVRTKGYHFEPLEEINSPRLMMMPKPRREELCGLVQSDIQNNEVMGNFASALLAASINEHSIAEDRLKLVIGLDKSTPLAFHYLGKLFYEQGRWKESEIIFQLAIKYHLDSAAFKNYYDSLEARMPDYISKDCIAETFRKSYYPKTVDHYFLGTLYESWNHFSKAEEQYRRIISLDPDYVGGYYKLWRLLEKTKRYKDAEDVIRRYALHDKEQGNNLLYHFYERMCERFPESADWHYKAGGFSYRLAADNKDDFPSDIKFIEPDTNEEVYKYGDEKPASRRIPKPLPGTLELLNLPERFDMPRTEGIKHLLKADSLLQLDDDATADIHQKIGDLYVWQGLTSKASHHYKKAIDLNPGDAALRLKIIDTYAATYLYRQTLVQLDSLNSRGEINFAKQILLAKYYIQSAQFAKADTLLKDAQKIHPYKMPEIIDLQGRLMLLSQRPKEALPHYMQLLALNRNDHVAMYTIARLYAKLGKTAEAWKWLEGALLGGFNYSFILRFDPYIENLRASPKWNSLLKNFTMKSYAPQEKSVIMN